MGQAVTKTDADRAYEVERKIVEGCRAIRTAWVALAAFLSEFHEQQMWEALGHESFNVWLASPDIGLGRSHAYALIEAYRELVLEREVGQEQLSRFDATKVTQVLPALRRGEITLQEALSDCESLSRSDLRAKYAGTGGRSKTAYELCDLCGKQRKVEDGG